MSSIDIQNLRKAFKAQEVVRGVSLSISSGEFVVILGPSGCGKSTLLRMIAGLEEITGGTVAIDGRVVNALEPRERGCAMVFQNYALYPHMTVAENIGYALKVAGVPKRERGQRVEAVARALELEPFLGRRPAELSGGQRQRVAMGRAMIREPKVFLFDEPLSNLDAKLRVGMRAEIRALHRRLGTTSVFVTHDQVEAMTLADRLVVMNGGLIEQAGTPAEVYNRPATRFVAAFVGAPAMNLVDVAVSEDGLVLPGAERLRLQRLPAAPGTAVTLGVRPEAVALVSPQTPGAVPATVSLVEELGSARVVHALVGATPFAVATTQAQPPAPGSAVGLLLDERDLHVFDAVTGARLDTPQPTSAPVRLHA